MVHGHDATWGFSTFCGAFQCLFQSLSLTLSTLMLIMIWEEKKGILGGESSINDAVIVKTGISKTYVLGCMDTDDRVTKINTTSLCSIPLKVNRGGWLRRAEEHCWLPIACVLCCQGMKRRWRRQEEK